MVYDDDGLHLEQLLPQRLLETHVLRALDGQPVPGVVVHHLRDGQEAALEVAQLEVARVRVATDLHVHEALGAPEIEIIWLTRERGSVESLFQWTYNTTQKECFPLCIFSSGAENLIERN